MHEDVRNENKYKYHLGTIRRPWLQSTRTGGGRVKPRTPKELGAQHHLAATRRIICFPSSTPLT
jgi:hypothetical protein